MSAKLEGAGSKPEGTVERKGTRSRKIYLEAKISIRPWSCLEPEEKSGDEICGGQWTHVRLLPSS